LKSTRIGLGTSSNVQVAHIISCISFFLDQNYKRIKNYHLWHNIINQSYSTKYSKNIKGR
jgi:hypothetical protein